MPGSFWNEQFSKNSRIPAYRGEQQRQLTYLNAHTGTPHWSADSKNITCVGGNPDIYVISAEGGKPRRMTDDAAEDTCSSWSSDGNWIYFASTRSGSLQIWKMPAQGFEGFESQDGKFFYYTQGRGIPGIWRIPAAGGEETEILTHSQAGVVRAWAVVHDGIYFTSAETAANPKD